MTQPRLPHHRAAPGLTGGTATPTPPCADAGHVYDALTDYTRPDPEYITAAQNMCATCILRTPQVADDCLRRAIAHGDRWASHVLGRRLTAAPPEPVTAAGRAAAGAHERRRAERLEELHALVARGAELDEACEVLSVSRDALWRWCDRWGHSDVWRALNPNPKRANQYREQPGVIDTRRQRDKRRTKAAA